MRKEDLGTGLGEEEPVGLEVDYSQVAWVFVILEDLFKYDLLTVKFRKLLYGLKFIQSHSIDVLFLLIQNTGKSN